LSDRSVGRIHALYPYEGALARALRRFKFGGEASLAGPLGRMLARSPILHESPEGRPWDWVCAVPLHASRRWVRGYDQAHLLAQWTLHHARAQLAPRLPPLDARLLRRKRATQPQSDLGLGERLSNLRGAFEARRSASLEGQSVLVIDDVTTTGATLHACFDALESAGVGHCVGLTLMRTLDLGGALRASERPRLIEREPGAA